MGIKGLLPMLKSITERVHVGSYCGEKVAVDAYSWLHKGAFGCATDLALGKPTDGFVRYCMARVNLLQSFDVTPVMVFDGAAHALKEEEESNRDRLRKENQLKGDAHAKAGNMRAASDCYQKSVDVTPDMAKKLIEELKRQHVDFVVAPYEADAQIAYLAKCNEVFAVLTEDSDMLAYGCPRVLFKLDKSGNGEEIQLKNLCHNRSLPLVGFTHQLFLEMCIMSGCDFLKGLPGIGIKKAHQQLARTKSFVKACRAFRLCGIAVPEDYEIQFQRAIWLFRHQRVFCRNTRMLVHLTPIPSGVAAGNNDAQDFIHLVEEDKSLSFLGPSISDEDAGKIACGDMNPITKQPYEMTEVATQSSQSSRPSWRAPGLRKSSACTRNSGSRLPVASNSIANYFTKGLSHGIQKTKTVLTRHLPSTKGLRSSPSSGACGAEHKENDIHRKKACSALEETNPEVDEANGSSLADNFACNNVELEQSNSVNKEDTIAQEPSYSIDRFTPRNFVNGSAPLDTPIIKGLVTEEFLLDYTSPSTPRSIAFFNRTGASPDILCSDPNFLDCATGWSPLGSLRPETSTFNEVGIEEAAIESWSIGKQKPFLSIGDSQENLHSPLGGSDHLEDVPDINSSLDLDAYETKDPVSGAKLSNATDLQASQGQTDHATKPADLQTYAYGSKRVSSRVHTRSQNQSRVKNWVGSKRNLYQLGCIHNIDHVDGFAKIARDAIDRLDYMGMISPNETTRADSDSRRQKQISKSGK